MTVIKIGAVWCNGCLVMRPRWQEIEKENPWLKTKYFDYDQDRAAIEKYGISSGNLPVFIFLDKRGEELERVSGEVDKVKLVGLVNKYRTK